MAPNFPPWPTLPVRLLTSIARISGEPDQSIPYEPARWFDERPTDRNRSRWSRWTRRLAKAGLLSRTTEPKRDRTQSVAVTREGWQWIVEHCGEGAVTDLNLSGLPLSGLPPSGLPPSGFG